SQLEMMKLQVTALLAVLLNYCASAPILQPRIGIIASNSNEVLRLNGITLAGVGMGQAQGGTPFLSPFLFQQQPEILLPPQILNFGPQLPGPFLPPQQNQVPQILLPPNQQEQATVLNPNNPALNQNPAQVVPQFFPFPQGSGGQAFPYYLTYGFPPYGNPAVRPPPNQKTALQIPVRPTLAPLQPIQVGYYLWFIWLLVGHRCCTVTMPYGCSSVLQKIRVASRHQIVYPSLLITAGTVLVLTR
ncbi:hypothetical protein NFI96_021762, partial [Prochilodus magdalenae]